MHIERQSRTRAARDAFARPPRRLEQGGTRGERFYFMQTPAQIWMIWQRDHMVRRIFMSDQHAETVRPSWFGHSIGRYESDGTLVIDTIGLSTRNSFIDWYRTPH